MDDRFPRRLDASMSVVAARRGLVGLACVAVVLSTVVLGEHVGRGAATSAGLRVIVTGADGAPAAAAPLGSGREFGLRYVHSVYGAPSLESFVADDAGFRLVSVSSTSPLVLDYYGLEGRRLADGRVHTLRLRTPQRFTELPVIATLEGRRTLVVGRESIPLFDRKGPEHVVLCVGPRPERDCS